VGGRGGGGGAQGRRWVLPRRPALEEEEIVVSASPIHRTACLALHGRRSIDLARAWNLETNACRRTERKDFVKLDDQSASKVKFFDLSCFFCMRLGPQKWQRIQNMAICSDSLLPI
jgi:hypothetical protein